MLIFINFQFSFINFLIVSLPYHTLSYSCTRQFLSALCFSPSEINATRHIGYSKENLKIHTVSPPLPSFPPSPSSPPMPSPHSPLPLPSYIPFPQKQGPLNPARGLGERCKLPHRSLGQSPSRNRFWCILSLKSDIWWQRF